MRDFYINVPAVCGAIDEAGISKSNELCFDFESKGIIGDQPGSTAFGHDPDDPLRRNRLAFRFDCATPKGQEDRDYAHMLSDCAILSHRILSHGDDQYIDLRDSLKDQLVKHEPNHPEVSKLLTVDQAIAMESWA